MPNINNIVKQLKNRKVFRSIAIYAGFAFVLLQVCDIVIPRLFLPEWTMTLIIVFVIIGFPTTLVLSWIYDITPTEEGETPSTVTSQPLGLYASTGLVLTVIGIGFWVSVGVFGFTFGSNEKVPSIGILMMDNLGDKEDEFWSSGITADLITKVAGAGLIRVAPIKDILIIDKKLSVEEIANELRVKYLFTHSFHKKQDVFDLWYQLINTEDGTTVLTNKISESLDMTTRIVGKLANDIIKSLNVSTKQHILHVPTTNAEAYEYYLLGRYKYKKQKNEEDISIAKELLRKAIDLDADLIDATVWLGQIYNEEDNSKKALIIFEESLIKSRELGDSLGVAASLIGIGDVQSKLGKIDTAITCWKQAISIESKIGDKRGIARLKLCQCQSSKVFDNLEENINYYKESVELAKEIEDSTSIAFNQMEIGILYKKNSEFDQAINYYNQALNIYEELDDKVKKLWAIRNIGNVYYKKDDFDNAFNYYEQALEIAEESDKISWIIKIHQSLGDIYFAKGDDEKAWDYYNRSLEIAEEGEDMSTIGWSLNNIGDIYKDKYDYDNALNYYNRSLNILKSLDKKSWLGRELAQTAYIYHNIGYFDEALDYYTSSLKIFDELADKDWIRSNLSQIGLVYWQTNNYKIAIEHLEKSLAIAKEIEIETVKILRTIVTLNLTYKKLGKDYDLTTIHNLLKDAENIKFHLNYRLYNLLDDIVYLETAYNQVQETANAMEDELGTKFLSYPISKAIVEEWEKVN